MRDFILVIQKGGFVPILIRIRTCEAPRSQAVLWILIRRFCMFLGLLDPDPLVRSTYPDADPSIRIIRIIVRKTLISNFLLFCDVNVPSN